jgi:hypothetical protein
VAAFLTERHCQPASASTAGRKKWSRSEALLNQRFVYLVRGGKGEGGLDPGVDQQAIPEYVIPPAPRPARRRQTHQGLAQLPRHVHVWRAGRWRQACVRGLAERGSLPMRAVQVCGQCQCLVHLQQKVSMAWYAPAIYAPIMKPWLGALLHHTQVCCCCHCSKLSPLPGGSQVGLEGRGMAGAAAPQRGAGERRSARQAARQVSQQSQQEPGVLRLPLIEQERCRLASLSAVPQ